MPTNPPLCPKCRVEARAQVGPFPGDAEEKTFAVSWSCPRCQQNLTLEVSTVGPLVPRSSDCLNCGHPAGVPAEEYCPMCGASRAEILAEIEAPAGTDPVARAQAEFQRGRYSMALLLLNHTLASDPGHTDAWLRKDSFLKALGYHAARRAMLESALAAGAPRILQCSLGSALADEGEHERAVAAYRRFLADASEDRQSAAVMINLANSLRALNRDAEAEPLYRRAIELDPTDGSHCWNFARHLSQRGRLREAAEVLCKGLETAIRNDWFQLLLVENARILAAQAGDGTDGASILWGKDAEAQLEMFRRAIEREPTRASHYAACVRVLTDLERNPEALRIARAGLDRSAPDAYEVVLREDESWLHAEAGSGAAALRSAEAALALDPQRTRARYLKGRALCLLGRLEEGRTVLEEIVALDPGHEDARRALTMIAEALGPRAARKWWQIWK